MIKIATPVSHLFSNRMDAEKIIKASDCLEFRDHDLRLNSFSLKEEIYHCDIQPIHELSDESFQHLKNVSKIKKKLKLVTFHVATACDKPITNMKMFQPGGRLYKKYEMLKFAKKNFSVIKSIFGNKVKIGVENNNYYPTKAYNYITSPVFLSCLISDNDLYMVLDLAHAKITAHNTGIFYEDYKRKLPLGRVIQLHISSYGIMRDNLAYDAHMLPGADEYREVRSFISDYDVRYVSIEYYRSTRSLLGAIKKMRTMI